MPKGSLWNYEIEASYQQYIYFSAENYHNHHATCLVIKAFGQYFDVKAWFIGIQLVHGKNSIP